MVSNDDVNMVVEPLKIQPIYQDDYYGDYHLFTVTVPSGYRWRIRNITVNRHTAGGMYILVSAVAYNMQLADISSGKYLYYEPSTPWWAPAGYQFKGVCETIGSNDNEYFSILYEQDTEY